MILIEQLKYLPESHNDFIFFYIGNNFFRGILTYYLCINIILFILMFIDKHRAKSHKWRIREKTLFFFSLIGGSIGGFLAMFIFHHKTRKPLFYIVYALGLIINAFLLYLYYIKFL